MSFKIVQTTENGEICLTAVPYNWENMGILYWPNTKKVSSIQKLLRDPHSKPEANWTTQPCTKKRENCRSFEAAEEEIRKMEDYSDTDGWNVETLISPQHIKRKVCTKIKAASNGVDYDFNDMLTYAQGTPVDPLLQQPQPNSFTTFTLPSSPGYQYQQSQISPSYQQSILQQIQSPEEVEDIDIGSLIINISERLTQIEQNQNIIMRELAKQSAFKDIIINRINDVENLLNNNKNFAVHTVEDNTNASSAVLLDAPISNQDEIDELEDTLNDSKKMEDLVAKMKVICGEKGTADATNCCYRLVDHLFTREFLLNVSWSGGSRTDNKKIALKNYRNILSVFNSAVRLAASDFDDNKSKEFFATVLKNAKKRTENNIDRIPRTSAKKVYVRKGNQTRKSENVPKGNDVPLKAAVHEVTAPGICSIAPTGNNVDGDVEGVEADEHLEALKEMIN